MNRIGKLTRGKAPAPKPAESVRLLSSTVRPLNRDVMVEKAAYYHAERRGFEPGHELEDWLQAEAEIDEFMQHTDPSEFFEDLDSGSDERPW